MNALPNIKTDFAEWYNEVIYQAELADHSPVRGSLVIRPYGYALWEHIKDQLDKRIKETGHQNAAFPLLIPESFLQKEAKHVEGFSPELAIVTYAGGKKLDEPLVIRPTSETIIHYMFAKWIKSWRDLPIKINQWANVVRWEMRPRAFLRTTEFFWQEGHTAHATYKQAEEEAVLMMHEYVTLAQEWLAIPVIKGRKSEHEKFPGADITLTFEGLMQDGKALQMGTSHLLSQNFAQSFDMKFQDVDGNLAYPYLTSWGVTTRLIGAVIMTHGDAKGLILPPKIAPIQLVIVPIFRSDEDKAVVMHALKNVEDQLKKCGIRYHIDNDMHKSAGSKFYKWELKGVPLRLEVGPRDLAQQKVVLVDRLGLAKDMITLDTIGSIADKKLQEIQKELFVRAEKRLKSMWYTEQKLVDFGPRMEKDGGLYQTGWCQNPVCEQELKKYKAFTRCLLDTKTMQYCFHCMQPSVADVLVAKAY